ncbi:imidazoleglycerol-phosphate dehydratase HisB [Candidatus Aerophobetes bacterium]|uniref:Imidazoleglycerol-phosphate dehydratase n=1 Tax=Aerophobetes bacterium TaxID=2030807 RepID=A0A662DDC2_UNCAE|nr:MAG: imidazoleglycerol-phosphate dehydratase HisB [Candidatus Aerophobetes bacterium]
MTRQAEVTRKTEETQVKLYLNLDGTGKSVVDTGYPFLDHMLKIFSYHGFFDLQVKAHGDIKVDEHHLVEDVGICLGRAFSQALGDKRGIKRYGWSIVPMDDVLVQCAVDISGRPLLVFNMKGEVKYSFKDFFRAFCTHSGFTIHLNVLYGEGYHHILEGVFKSFGVSLDQATSMDERRKDIPSTKGHIEEV